MDKEALEKYLYPKVSGLVVGSVFLVLGIFGAMIESSIPIFLICALVAAIFSAEPGMCFLKMKQFLKTCESNNTLSEVLQDFNSGKSMLNRHIRLGNKYIIGRGGSVATKYDEIVRVYEYVHKTNFAVDQHALMVETKSDSRRILCRLPLKNVSNNDLLKVYAIIKSKNKSVEIGYR